MGKFRRRNEMIEGFQHDGSNSRAIELESWVNSEGGHATAYLKGSIDFAQNNSFIRIDSGRSQNLVGPGGWVIKAADKTFYAITKEDFNLLYIPALPDGVEFPND